MKVTVCELNADSEKLAIAWDGLVDHVKAHGSDLVLLPEMPFYPWFGASPDFNEKVWQLSVAAHDLWQERLIDLAPAVVLSTRPVNVVGQRSNEGFRWEKEAGYTKAHTNITCRTSRASGRPTGTVGATAPSIRCNLSEPK